MSSNLVKVIDEPSQVESRLSALELDKKRLLNVRSVALYAASQATPNHPANAAGQFAYLHGVAQLRDEFVGGDWQRVSIKGIELIENSKLGIRVGYSNVSRAHDLNVQPKATSKKGPASAVLWDNSYPLDFGPEFEVHKDTFVNYVLMVDRYGRAEITLPSFWADNFGAPLERIFLTDGSDFDKPVASLDDEDTIRDVLPDVVRI